MSEPTIKELEEREAKAWERYSDATVVERGRYGKRHLGKKNLFDAWKDVWLKLSEAREEEDG